MTQTGFGSTSFGSMFGSGLLDPFISVVQIGVDQVRVIVDFALFVPVSPYIVGDPLNPTSWTSYNLGHPKGRRVDRVSHVNANEVVLHFSAGFVGGEYAIEYLPGFGVGYSNVAYFQTEEVGIPDWVRFDFCAEGKKRLLLQYQGKPRMEAWICSMLEEIQLVEVAAGEMERDTQTDFLEGVSLVYEAQGRGINTDGKTEEQIRALIRVDDLSTTENGINDIIAALEIITAADPSEITITTGEGVIIVQLAEPTLYPLAVFEALLRVKAGGVAVFLEWLPAIVGRSFRFAPGSTVVTGSNAGFDAGLYAGVIAQ